MIKYVYDPVKQVLVVFEDGHMKGGYMGQIAENKFEDLLLTDSIIEFGRFMTAKERKETDQLNQPIKGGQIQ